MQVGKTTTYFVEETGHPFRAYAMRFHDARECRRVELIDVISFRTSTILFGWCPGTPSHYLRCRLRFLHSLQSLRKWCWPGSSK